MGLIMKKSIIIIGGGFAGVWSALSAVRCGKELQKENEVEVVLVSKDHYYGLRPRYYEQDLTAVRVPLDKFLKPAGIKFVMGEVSSIDHLHKTITLTNKEKISYDRLILAAGSQLYYPSIPGLREYSFNTDSYDASVKLAGHLDALPKQVLAGQFTAVVIGGSFTGLEVATELVERLTRIAHSCGQADKVRVIIVDGHEVGSALGVQAQPIIMEALKELKIEVINNEKVIAIDQAGIQLNSGIIIKSQTVIWAGGMRANPLTTQFPGKKDHLERIVVDAYLKISTVRDCFSAGDTSAAMTDDKHVSLMSCQHAMPQGRIAGHNAVADLFGKTLLMYRQEKYVTCLDLGKWGALYSEGWDRRVISQGAAAKKTKQYINQERIYPPLSENPEDLLLAASPVFKSLPQHLIWKNSKNSQEKKESISIQSRL